ncbi:MAG: hypothetical protein WAO12_09975 [Venatoribacter sp.]
MSHYLRKVVIYLSLYNFVWVVLTFFIDAYHYRQILTDPLSYVVFLGSIWGFSYIPIQAVNEPQIWGKWVAFILAFQGSFIGSFFLHDSMIGDSQLYLF